MASRPTQEPAGVHAERTPRLLRRYEGASPDTLPPGHQRRDYLLRRALAMADVLAISAAFAFALALSTTRPGLADLAWLLPTLPVWVLLFKIYGLYERDVKRINHDALDDIPRLFHALIVGTLGLWIFFRFLPQADRLVLGELLTFIIAAMVLVSAFRSLARRVIARTMGPERAVFLGETSTIPALVRKIRMHPEYGLEPVGIVPRDARGPSDPSLPVLGRLEKMNLEGLVRRHAIERLIVPHTEVEEPMLLDLLQQCGRLAVKVSILPRHFDALGPSVEVDDIEGVTLLDLNPPVLSRSSRLFKRVMDIVGAGVALVVLAPVMGLIAFAVRLDYKRPVLFRQERVGRRGQPFWLLKFRTMTPDAERQTDELLQWSQDPHWLKLERDPRVTRVGRVLRTFSLDELPQFINVLMGDMSLVGPRPLLPYQDARVTGWARTRLELAPGMTGLWQVLGRASIPFEEMVKLDTLYVTNWSLWLDLQLILRTLLIVVARRGAN